ncbi:pilus assembly protein TadG-related protein [Acidocella sp.]|uniref:pilus assembly protein TadG-related protein n=1 Tax=Acidocella sp. TaxID=50710 RepID=UPI003CFE3730
MRFPGRPFLSLPSLIGRGGKGSVALITALAAPLLLASTGLAVDIGYWMQQQEAMQSAADGAAISAGMAARSEVTSSSTLNSFVSGSGPIYAAAGANFATNFKYNFATSGSARVSLSVGSYGTTHGDTSATMKASVVAPRGSFFSRVAGPGLPGMPSGTQGTSAQVQLVANASSYCGVIGGGGITMSGGSGWLQADDCGWYSGKSSGAGITVNGSAKVSGTTVATAASSVSAPSYSGYIGTSTSPPNNGDTSTVTLNASTPTDELAGMNALDTFIWASSWSVPSAPSMTGPVTPNLGYNKAGYCGTDYKGNCALPPGYYQGIGSSSNINSLIMNSGASNGTMRITGGWGVNSNTTTTLNGDYYYIDGGMTAYAQSGMTASAGTTYLTCGTRGTYFCFVVNGQTKFQNTGYSFPAGVYFFTGPGSDYAVNVNTQSLSIGASTMYVNGGIEFTGSNANVTFGTGTYFFNSYSSSKPALYNKNATVTFSGGTYFFNGGLDVAGNGTMNFGPGIYYIENGNLVFESGSHVTANGATFVLENGAGFQFLGGYVGLNLTAPTSNCVEPDDYPESAYLSVFPYDGTNGEGICGISIYQARDDSTADTIAEGASTSFNGAIYIPSATLTISGGAALSITSTDLPALTAYGLVDNSSGTITLTENTSSGSSSSGSSSGSGLTSATVLLVQ